MVTCKECLHFEVCEALERNGINKVSPIQCGCYKPTADVVPKSEAEELQTEIEELQATVARLRKENIELLVSKETDILISMEKLVKVRTEHPIFKAITEMVASEIFAEIDILGTYNPTLYAELKKKYTEGEQ